MKAYWESRGIAPLILNPGLFTKEKDSWYSFNFLKPKTCFMYQQLSLTFRNSMFCPQCVYVFCVDLRKYSEFFFLYTAITYLFL